MTQLPPLLIRGLALLASAGGAILWWFLPSLLPPLPPECFQPNVSCVHFRNLAGSFLGMFTIALFIGYIAWEWRAWTAKRNDKNRGGVP